MEPYIHRLETARYVTAHDVIAQTPLGPNQDSLPVYYLCITDAASPQAKRNIVVVSGQHLGEVASAWMVTGLVNFLLTEDAMAHTLRQRFAFHIYPAVNPEGVKYGYYRRSADSRLNPNRAWRSGEVLEIKAVREHILAR
jgi:murein tripeptide amidase MpaA